MPNSCLWASRLQHPEGSEVVTKPKSVCILVSKTSLTWPSAAALGLAYRPGTQSVAETRVNDLWGSPVEIARLGFQSLPCTV